MTQRSPIEGGRPIWHWLAGFGLSFVLVMLLALVLIYPPGSWLPLRVWGRQLESAGVAGMLAFAFAGMLATSVGLPRQLLAFVAGLAYGAGIGLVLSLFAALAGCTLTLLISRKWLQRIIRRHFSSVIDTLEKLIQRDAFLKILVLRIQPLGTNLLTNLCAGLTSIRISVFLLASAVGYIPQMFVFSLTGAGVRVGSNAQLMVSAVLFVLSLVLGGMLYRRHLQRAS
ncbi:MAG: VTT domain-containing protein [Granulosicoccus sp.]